LGKYTKEFFTSLATVILAILAIALFISSGAGSAFYIVIAIAIIFGFYNAWLISVTGKQKEEAEQQRMSGSGRRRSMV
jgi:4-hydroxybenzoate polyprenyltransferase